MEFFNKLIPFMMILRFSSCNINEIMYMKYSVTTIALYGAEMHTVSSTVLKSTITEVWGWEITLSDILKLLEMIGGSKKRNASK